MQTWDSGRFIICIATEDDGVTTDLTQGRDVYLQNACCYFG
jgi:hypothetical protein